MGLAWILNNSDTMNKFHREMAVVGRAGGLPAEKDSKPTLELPLSYNSS